MKLKKFLVNLICGFIPSSVKRKQVRAELMNENTPLPPSIDSFNGNEIIIKRSGGTIIKNKQINGLNILFNGKNSTVILHEPLIFNNCTFKLVDNSKIEIAGSCYPISNLYIHVRNKGNIRIGENFSCCGCSIECHDEAGGNVNIGNDCQFSYGINIRESDGHTIYDNNTGKILNRPQRRINIGNHVWCGMQTKILKDVCIADNTIIGAGAIVTKSFNENNVIIAGIPAKILKHGVNWSRYNTDSYTNDYIKN